MHRKVKEIKVLTSEDVNFWLKSIDMAEYCEAFKEYGFNGKLLLFLNDENLENELKIAKKLHRKYLLEEIEELKKNGLNLDNEKIQYPPEYKVVEEYTREEVISLLVKIGKDKYCNSFKEYGINGGMLVLIDDTLYKEELHITNEGDRLSIFTSVEKLKADSPRLQELRIGKEIIIIPSKQSPVKKPEEEDKKSKPDNVIVYLPPAKYPILVLYTDAQRISKLCSLEHNFEVTQRPARPSDHTSRYDYMDIEKYAVIIFDFQDSGAHYHTINETEQKLILKYLKNGGSILWTHDQIDALRIIRIQELYEYCGIERCSSDYTRDNECIVVDSKHSIFKAPNDLTKTSRFSCAEAHQSEHKLIEGKLLISFSHTNRNYLLVNEMGKARCAYLAAGHSYDFTTHESKLFVNIIYWLASNPNK